MNSIRKYTEGYNVIHVLLRVVVESEQWHLPTDIAQGKVVALG